MILWCFDFIVVDCRYEKLQDWDAALEAYDAKALHAQENSDELQSATLGLFLILFIICNEEDLSVKVH